MASAGSSAVIYATANDWPTWDPQFQTQARAQNIWEFIDPQNPQPWPQRQPTPSPQDVSTAANPSFATLTPNQQAAYRNLFATWREHKSYWDQVDAGIQALVKWCNQSIRPALADIYFPPGQTLTQWYATIRNAAAATTATFFQQARTKYQQHMTPEAVRKARTYEEWITNWEIVVVEGAREGVVECSDNRTLAQDLGKTIRAWPGMSELAHSIYANHATFNVATVAGDMRSRLMIEGVLNKKPPKVDYKAAFSAVQVSTDNEGSEQGSDRGRNSPSKRSSKGNTPAPPRRIQRHRGGKKPSFGQKRNRSEDEDDEDPQPSPAKKKRHEGNCQACEIYGHSIDDCQYTHADLRPKGWRPHKQTLKLVELKIKTDPAMKKAADDSIKRRLAAHS